MSRTSQKPKIIATSQQSRFHTATQESTTNTEIDLHDVSISVGDVDLLVDAHVRLKNGVRYGLIGRNGAGKSTLLKALVDKLIPGLSNTTRILLVSQIEEELATEHGPLTVLEHVIQACEDRQKIIKEYEQLNQALQSPDPAESQAILNTILLQRAQQNLEIAQRTAARRSGTRGKQARAEELKAEDDVRLAEERLQAKEVEDDWSIRASGMLQTALEQMSLLESDPIEALAVRNLTGLGFSKSMMEGPYSALSGGWRSRCSLAVSLLVSSDILLLDEPSNFLDLKAIIWLENYLISAEPRRTLVVVSHDHMFLDRVVEETMAIRNQKITYFEGTPHAMDVIARKDRKGKEKMQAALDKKEEHVKASIQKGRQTAKKTGDENRVRMVKSRQKKLDERWGLERSAAGGRFKINRDLEGYHSTRRSAIEIEAVEARDIIRIQNPPALRTKGVLLHLENISIRYPGQKAPVLQNVSLTLDQGGRCALVGANGQGKSTLAKLIMGELEPITGKVKRHPLMKIGYYSQHSVEELSKASADTTALRHFMQQLQELGIAYTEGEIRACLGSFGLKGKTTSDTPLSALSGGQKVRLAIAMILYRSPNLLVLDEVTTHVDPPTITALAKALKRYSGGIVLITHDRWFSKTVVEGLKPFSEDSDGSDSEVSSSSDEDDIGHNPGQTLLVARGKVAKLPGGMQEYENMVQRKLARQKR